MRKIIVDSSVIVKWLSQQDEERLEKADKIILDAQNGKIILLAPELAKYEIGNAFVIHKEISKNEAVIIFKNMYILPLQFINQTEELAIETFNIAKDRRITFYDASFITLAKQEKAILVTDNPKHQTKEPGVQVIALKDY